MEVVIMIAQLILGLSLLIGIHEVGHMLAAKYFKMRVEKFSIGFPPKIFGFKWGETEYSLGATPLGGFVKISGMIDESLDVNSVKNEPQPWEFRAKPAWQRLIVMLGGIIFNVISGVIIFIGLVYFVGDNYYSVSEINKYGIYVNELGAKIGLKDGDKIIKVNGKEVDNFSDVIDPAAFLADNSSYTVVRDNQEITIKIPTNFLDELSQEQRGMFMAPQMPFKVGEIIAKSHAEAAGLLAGDSILKAAGTPILFFHNIKKVLTDNKGKQISLEVVRNGEIKTLNVQVAEEGTIGFVPQILLQESFKKYSLAEAIPMGAANAFEIIFVQVKAFSKIFSGEISASNSLSGPIGMAKVFGGTINWVKFWTIVGMLSMVLAFMNLLPIPALDGGHVVFLTYEMIVGTPPSDKFLIAAQKVGMVILLGLMIFAFGNDIYKFFV
jgi:regulator of sigma E protease